MGGGGGGGEGGCQTFSILSSFPCSADHERSFFRLATNTLNVRNLFTFFLLTGGCSEGVDDAFRFSLRQPSCYYEQ